ncbi:MAG: hypothetical protein N3G77_02295 [Nitrososphaeria archaeon]|nr:hypothetical protein [Nitrososphaeria archaeon]
MKRVLTIILLALTFLLTFYYILLFPLYTIVFKPELVREERRNFENYMLDHGYQICGEVSLDYGKPFIARFSKIFYEEVKCIVFFNLPEPKKDYVVYDPIFEMRFVPVNMEDMNKTYLYHFADGAPGLVVYQLITAPFRNLGKGISSMGISYYELYRHGQRGVDLFVIFSYKPLELDKMPMNVTIIVDTVIVRFGEKHTPPIRPTPPKTSEEWIKLMKEVDLELERIGYEKCGEYILDPGKNVLNLTYTFDPFKGKACYIKILPRNIARQEVILSGKHTLGTADSRQVSGILEERSTPPIFYTDPHNMIHMLKPEYLRYVKTPFPEPYSNTRIYDTLSEGSGNFGSVRGGVIYLCFSWKLSPNSRIDEGAGFKVTYDFDLDLEVVEKG